MLTAIGESVIVKFTEIVNDTLEFESGVRLYFDPSWEIQDNVIVHAEVMSVGGRVKEDIAPGDTAYISYFAVLMALGSRVSDVVQYPVERWYEDSTGLYASIGIGDIYFVVRDEKIINLNDRVLVKNVMEVVKSDFLDIKPKPYEDRSEVLVSDREDLHPGDVVVHKSFTREKIGDRLHNRLPGFGRTGFEIYTIQVEDIGGVIL